MRPSALKPLSNSLSRVVILGFLFAGLWCHLPVASGFCLTNLPAVSQSAKPEKILRKKVAILVFQGVELLDFAGPGEVFASCRDAEGTQLFEVYTVGINKQPVESLQFVTLTPKYDPTDAPAPDILVIPGGNVIPLMDDSRMNQWITQQAKMKCLLFSVCNGASVLARLGFLDGLKVTTHHGNMEILNLLAPKAICLRDRRFVDNGTVLTAAGVSAGIDGALYLVARLKGIEVARRSATYMEFDYWSGFESQGSDRLKTDTDGVISQQGRIHQDRQWAVMVLLKKIQEDGVEAALIQYPKLLEAATGHDREMIEEAGLDESAWWVFKNGRDPEVGLSILRFIAGAHPQSSRAQERLGQAYLEAGQEIEARKCFLRCLELDPKNAAARKMLDQLQSGAKP